MNDSLKIEADVAGFVKAKETVKSGLDEIERKAQTTSQRASAAMDKVASSMNKASRAAASGGGGGGGTTILGGMGGSRKLNAAVSRATGRIAGRGAGSTIGRIAGGAVGPLGMIVGSAIGGGLASMLGGGSDGASREEEKADMVGQLIARGFSKKQSDAFATLGQDMEAKFKIGAERIASAVTEAKAGDDGQLQGILKDMGIDPNTVNSVNEALTRMAAASNGAADKAEEKAKSPLDKSLERLGKTGTGIGIGAFFEGVAGAPGEILRGVSGAAAKGTDMITNLLGGPLDGGSPAAGSPALTNNAPLDNDVHREAMRKAKRGPGGDMRIIVSAPINVPIFTKNMGGR